MGVVVPEVSLTDVHLTNFDWETSEIFQKEFTKYFTVPEQDEKKSEDSWHELGKGSDHAEADQLSDNAC